MSPPPLQRIHVEGKFFRESGGGASHFFKALTYGPFRGECGLPGPRRLADDLDLLASLGANAVRVYEPPPRAFLDACASRGLHVLAGLAWESHIDFLRRPELFSEIVARAKRPVASLSGHPALAGWLVGNEIHSDLVRWMGAVRTQRAVEKLIEALREVDAETLFAYANYPSTEYLSPRNADFVALNIYLEKADALERYLRRAQVLAADKPVLITEFGCDSATHGEEGQAASLSWHIDVCRASGVGGTAVFSFTDEWFRGGEDVLGWSFGVTDGQRRPKLSSEALRRAFAREGGPPTPPGPKVSVIICTFNGVRTMDACLRSMAEIRYPDYEVLVVDDGSPPGVDAIVGEHPHVRYIRQEHSGLSVARNHGAAEAGGDILVYTDDDCIADPDWLAWLVPAFEDPAVDAAGGPNVPPPPRNRIEACVGVAPGAPAHVLIDDVQAEHLPGCNLAVRRHAFDAVGGFRAKYRAAGDDVDFCWRILDRGGRIAFVPNAMVWHHRRATVEAYIRQQIGYGKAEAILTKDHGEKFGAFGGARWQGGVYRGGFPVSAADTGARVYHGAFGSSPYQLIYTGVPFDERDVFTGLRWVVVSAVTMALALVFAPTLAFVPGLMLALPLIHAGRAATRAPVSRAWGRWRCLWVLFVLNLVQPLVRGGARWIGRRKEKVHPAQPFSWGLFVRALRPRRRWRGGGERAYWSDAGAGRREFLNKVAEVLQEQGVEVEVEPVEPVDYLVVNPGGKAWQGILTVTEFHGGDRYLTRARYCTHTAVGGAGRFGLALLAAFVGWWLWGPSAKLPALVTAGVVASSWATVEGMHLAVRRRMKTVFDSAARGAGLTVYSDVLGNMGKR